MVRGAEHVSNSCPLHFVPHVSTEVARAVTRALNWKTNHFKAPCADTFKARTDFLSHLQPIYQTEDSWATRRPSSPFSILDQKSPYRPTISIFPLLFPSAHRLPRPLSSLHTLGPPPSGHGNPARPQALAAPPPPRNRPASAVEDPVRLSLSLSLAHLSLFQRARLAVWQCARCSRERLSAPPVSRVFESSAVSLLDSGGIWDLASLVSVPCVTGKESRGK
jgi:hypothetical protein